MYFVAHIIQSHKKNNNFPTSNKTKKTLSGVCDVTKSFSKSADVQIIKIP